MFYFIYIILDFWVVDSSDDSSQDGHNPIKTVNKPQQHHVIVEEDEDDDICEIDFAALEHTNKTTASAQKAVPSYNATNFSSSGKLLIKLIFKCMIQKEIDFYSTSGDFLLLKKDSKDQQFLGDLLFLLFFLNITLTKFFFYLI